LLPDPFSFPTRRSSDLLRASYGYTGNNNVSPYATTNSLDKQLFYDFNGTTANGWLPSILANSNLGWEKTREMNFGLDFGFANNRDRKSTRLNSSHVKIS